MRHRNLLDATTPSQSEPGNDGNEGVFCIPQGPSITGTSASDCLVSYPEHSLGESYASASVIYRPSTRPNMPFQSDAPEGSDTFRWQLWGEIA